MESIIGSQVVNVTKTFCSVRSIAFLQLTNTVFAMIIAMLISFKKHKIFKSIVDFNPVNVMNNFGDQQFSSNRFFHKISVFKNLFPTDTKRFVSVFYKPTFSNRFIGRMMFFKSTVMQFAKTTGPMNLMTILKRTLLTVWICFDQILIMNFAKRFGMSWFSTSSTTNYFHSTILSFRGMKVMGG